MTDDNLTIGGADKAQPLRIPCKIYSRIVGYLTAVDGWNAGKRAEYEDRTMFDVAKSSPESGHITQLGGDDATT